MEQSPTREHDALLRLVEVILARKTHVH